MSEPTQFDYDFHRIMCSLALRPTNWVFYYPHSMWNHNEDLSAWIGFGKRRVAFRVGIRRYANQGFWPCRWQRQLYNRAQQTGSANCVKKTGVIWDNTQELRELNEALRAMQASPVGILSFKRHELSAYLYMLYVWFKKRRRIQRYHRDIRKMRDKWIWSK